MSNEIMDFDLFLQEQEKKGPQFKLYGEVYTLPPSLPALIVLKMVRLSKQYGGKIPDEAMFDLAMAIFDEKNVNEWVNKGLTLNGLQKLIEWAYAQYAPGSSDEDSGEEPTNKENQ